MTPEIFATKGLLPTRWRTFGTTNQSLFFPVRGTACGTASALSRVYSTLFVSLFCSADAVDISGGMLAPLAGGALLVADRSFPVYASIVIFVASGLSVLPLKVSDVPGGGGMLH
jgi:hypothetical protein